MQQHLWDEATGHLKRSFCRNPSAVQGFADDYSYLIGQPHSHLAAACCCVLSHILLLLAAVFSATSCCFLLLCSHSHLVAACCCVLSHKLLLLAAVLQVMTVGLSVYMLCAVMTPSALHHWLFWGVIHFPDLSSLAPGWQLNTGQISQL